MEPAPAPALEGSPRTHELQTSLLPQGTSSPRHEPGTGWGWGAGDIEMAQAPGSIHRATGETDEELSNNSTATGTNREGESKGSSP